MSRKLFGVIAVAGLGLAVAGCATVAVQGASRAKDQASIAMNESAAEQGDVNAQLKMGDSHCCSIAGAVGVLNNQKATRWYCKAAHQDNARAKYELGRIYAGDLVRGANAPARVGSFLTSQRENLPLALMWFELAAAQGHSDALEEARDLREDMSTGAMNRTTAMKSSWQNQPCEWNEVYPDNQL